MQYQSIVDLNPSNPEAYMRLALTMIHNGDYKNSEEFVRKSLEIDPLDPNVVDRKLSYFFIYMGLQDFKKAYEFIEEILEYSPNAGFYKGFKASVGHLNKGNEAKTALEDYLKMHPNLKTKEGYKKIFVPNSSLADILIEGLVKAGWEPKN